jgi:hypothetical protein
MLQTPQAYRLWGLTTQGFFLSVGKLDSLSEPNSVLLLAVSLILRKMPA